MMRLIRKNILLITDSTGKEHLYNLPIGITVKNYLLKEIKNDKIVIQHQDKPGHDFSKLINLYKSNTPLEFDFSGEKLFISLVYENRDYLESIALLRETHYMNNVPNGLYITLKRDSELIGVIVFSKLTYTVPVGRQIYFSGNSISKEEKEELREFSNHNTGWISRIVIKEKSKGYGVFFLESLPKLIGSIFPNGKLDFVEVLTSSSEKEITQKLNLDVDITREQLITFKHRNDFFSKAGYLNIEIPSKKALGIRRNYIYENGIRLPKKERVKKFYYMKELSNQKRLFVPLAKEAYEWFLNNDKQWEIRKLNSGQYNTKNLVECRRVELRLGYRPGNSIWGVIDAVKMYNNADELVNAINFKLLIPTAKNKNEAIERINDFIGEESQIITFKVIKDNE